MRWPSSPENFAYCHMHKVLLGTLHEVPITPPCQCRNAHIRPRSHSTMSFGGQNGEVERRLLRVEG
eukprot:3481165-Rhodomonas_salina.3